MEWVFDTLGLLGVGLILLAYFLLQAEKIGGKSLSYLVMNVIAATMILISLLHDWNLPSVVMECCWIAISIFGIVKHHIVRRKIDGI